MKEIILTRNLVARVDDEDFEELNQYKWYANPCGKRMYACRDIVVKGKKTRKYMHREILKPENRYIVVDHIDRDGLNNSRSNMRLCSGSENMCNARLRSDNTSGYKGISWNKRRDKWRVRVNINKQEILIGHFDEIEDAIEARDAATFKYHGEFANIDG